ncbi:NuoM family protein [Streptomyces antimycoticus]|uniref:NADH-quinone oxidoreductase subunit M n=2 Tax=Streptomyces violaceusniger group TaxID=2839105 RepID=A0ABD5J5U9_9ACTN|nr:MULTISPECIES: NADH-quinone oxidoreductase subunit M [Streptomyces]MEE4583732.1 NADH-quinone oxidoreductase subunit M [Streptomyces sp. DSM 41602]AJZ86494.2 NADH-quinone oxidoreductase subunit M [Streptomyces sp. AgN23]KUL44413.1 NADH-quinone oxidoreductase subunit M [Streptomyces violaceusniger]RSS36451.1 NADH-quinone oxidoreductase subunit M [Streptomyces sp. WAC05858]WJD97956.1 NADH-quinone oxidoreductase subunit M [Streptomyces antimycoticus]
MNHTVQQLLLAALVVLPLLGSAAALLPAPPGLRGRGPDQAVLRHGVTVTGVVLAAAIALAAGFDHDHPARMQAQTDIGWIPALDIRIHLGVDGVSLPLLVLTALLTFLSALYAYFNRPSGPSPKAFVALLLLLESGTLASFAVLDLMLFFLAFEMVLIPMYFLINRWGSGERERAAWRFILYTLLGSVVMLLGLLLVGLGGGTFDMVALATTASDSASGAGGSELSHTTQLIAALAIIVGLAVKAPMWPLHSWLPDAHTAAPTVGSVLLAGVLLKMGTYGLVRIVLPMTPGAAHTYAPYLAAFAVVGIIYGSLACLALARTGAKGDLKRLIAYSSVGHMGFVLLGIATLTPTGVNGALFANIAHGLITGLLFFLVGALKDRSGTTDLDQLAGTSGAALYGRAPRLGGLLAFGAVASLGLPGLAGFWGEMLAMFGAFDPADGLSRPAYLTYMALAGLGTLLTAAYMLIVVRRVCMGDHPIEPRIGTEPERPALADVHGHELAAWSPLVALTVLAGLWPAALLGLTDPAVQQLLAGGNR